MLRGTASRNSLGAKTGSLTPRFAGLKTTYTSWKMMRQRCLQPKNEAYYRYGGAGIGICARWDDFEKFLDDMGPRPAGTTLDRIDGTKDYSPDNCRWADWKTQGANRRSVYIVTLDGEEMPLIDASIRLGKHKTALTQFFLRNTMSAQEVVDLYAKARDLGQKRLRRAP